MKRLVLPAALRDQIVATAEIAFPHEACGLLVGYAQSDAIVVDEVAVSENLAADSATTFEVDPALRIRLTKQLRGTDRQIVGHFHSHPTGSTQPSQRDVAAAYEPDLVWLIVGMSEGKPKDLAGWQIKKGKSFPLSLVTDSA